MKANLPMPKLRIENNIPIPPISHFVGRPAARSKYPFARMTEGQSVAVPLATDRKAALRTIAAVRNAVQRVANPEAKFITRTMVDEKGKRVFRIWRASSHKLGGS